MTIGQTIRYFRNRRQMKQRRLAHLVGVAQSLVSMWECDQWTPNHAQLNAIAAAFGERVGIFAGMVARDEGV
jgi:transcriptional regulator with XRE-family HTH domain